MKPGTYTATFRYQTTATSPGSWGASPWPSSDLSPEVRNLLERLPAVDLIALTTFEVSP